jgi:uncharacterized cupin superfamily protein
LTALDPPQLARRLGAATATERSERVENRPSNVASEGDLGWSEQADGDKFGYRRKQLGSSAGGEKLGCSLYEVPPGRTAFPRHYHPANEEAIYVLEGSGTLRIGREEVELSRGTTWRCPWGAQRGRTNSSIPRGCATQVPVLLHDGGAGTRRADVGLAPHGRTS